MRPVIGNEGRFMGLSEEGLTHMKFPVVLHKDADSDYGVIIPDVPGCFSAGATVADAFENTQEALALHYEGWSPTARRCLKYGTLMRILITRITPEESGVWSILISPLFRQVSAF